VLRKNLGNPYISDIYVLTEELIDFSGMKMCMYTFM
jgi:hypothetical protein